MTVGEASPIYLDYNATAPLLPVVAEQMAEAQQAFPGNPSSPHRFGQAARERLETARREMAECLGIKPRELVFTSGGSESNTTVFAWISGGRVLTSPFEHPSVLESVKALALRGVGVDYLPVGADGVAEVEAVGGLLGRETKMISLMTANNETGVIQPVAALAEAVRSHTEGKHTLLHTDGVQALGRVESDWEKFDLITLTAHKLGGPRGIGALVVREGTELPPLILGGKQERGFRAGTEPLALVVGFQAALAHAFTDFKGRTGRMLALRERLKSQLEKMEGFFLNGESARRLPNTLNLGFSGVSAESLVVALDINHVAISTGSACQSGAMEQSLVLKAMGLSADKIKASVRISLGDNTTEAEVDQAAKVIQAEVERFRKAKNG